MHTLKTEIAQSAAAMVVEEGLTYGSAKRRAVKHLGLPAHTALPDNDTLEDAVREHLTLFHAQTQPAELTALRQLAWRWMQRMAAFRPYLTGAVWYGTATGHSSIDIELFCDDPKSAEIALLDQHVQYEFNTIQARAGKDVPVLSIRSLCEPLQKSIDVHLKIYDHNDLRGALKADSKGRTPRGDLLAVQRLLSKDVLHLPL